MKKLLLVFFFIIFAFATDGEYIYKESNLNTGEVNLNKYFTLKGAPDIYSVTKCSKDKNPVCWPVIKNNKGNILARYGSKDSVGSIIHSRYKNISYLLYYHSYKSGKYYKKDYFLMDNNGRKYNIPNYSSNSLNSIITKNRNILQVLSDGIYMNNNIILKSPSILNSAKIQNNLLGNIAIIAVNNKNNIVVSNTKKFLNTKLKLAKHGDRMNILSVYPINNNNLVWSIYKYTNSYNKGLVLGKVDFNNNQNIYGWLFNSEKRNIGFNPEIYVDNKMIYIGTTDSSNRDDVYFTISINKLQNIIGIEPKHIKGFENEKNFSFLVGIAESYLYWNATNSVKDESGNDYGDVTYDISNSLYQSIYLQGRIGNTQLAVTYLKNKEEKKGETTEKASKFLNAVFDINSLFDDASILRILVEKGEVNGIANWNGNDINGKPVVNMEFSTKIDRYASYVMKEQGFYYGLDYTKYIMPSLLGFSKDGSTKFVLFDPKAKIQKVTLDIGYDELSYAKRYENNFNRFFIQGLIGAGLGYVKMSNENIADNKAKEIGYNGVNTPITFAIDYGLNIGYIFQRKAKSLKGFGFSTQIGVRAKGTYFTAGTSSKNDNSSDDNKLSLEFDRNDIWYGPYVSLNLIF